MLAPGFQVDTGRNIRAWRVPYLQLMLQYQIDMIPYTCAEASFKGYNNGMLRTSHGIDFYMRLEGYEEHCRDLGEKYSEDIYAMYMSGFKFLAIIGIEHSPSCAVNYMYTHKGMRRTPGIFMAFLKCGVKKYEIPIPFIGINRTYPQKSLVELEKILINTLKEK